jgi:hypothetical protein
MQMDDSLCEYSGTLFNEGSMKVSDGSAVALCGDGHVMVHLNDSWLILSGQIPQLERQKLTMPHCSCSF